MSEKIKTRYDAISEGTGGAFTPEVIRQMISCGVLPPASIHRPDAIMIHLTLCKEIGANPLLKQAHMVPQRYKDHTGSQQDGFITLVDYRFKMAKAAANGEWGGTSPVTYNGGMSMSQCIKAGLKIPTTAEVTVYRMVGGVRVPISTMEVMWSEFGCNKPIWQDKPYHMLGKVAISHATSNAFPAEVGNLRTVEEFDHEPDATTPEDRLPEALDAIFSTKTLAQFTQVEQEWGGLFGNNPDFAKACNDRYNELKAEEGAA